MQSRSKSHSPRVKKWIFDSGCGVDLVSKRDIKGFENRIRDADEPLVFRTANGRTEAESTIRIPRKEIGGSLNSYVLQNTPAVVSMGKRCMEVGCSFVWPSGEAPFLIDPKGRVTVFEVKDNIPYITTGSDVCKRRKVKKRVRIPHVQDCAPNEGRDSDATSSSSSENEIQVGHDESSVEGNEEGASAPEGVEPPPRHGCSEKGHRRDRKADAESHTHTRVLTNHTTPIATRVVEPRPKRLTRLEEH
jgi:hypothetical protein